MRRLTTMAIALIACLTGAQAHALETPARAAIVVDLNSGAILLEKNADQALPPASMSKLMTLLMVFEALEEGRLSMDDTLPVSENAWRKGGSKMFVRVGDRITVRDLLHGVTVQSGNDACIVLAEGLAGSEEAFARRMNARAPEIGLTNSHFVNATGWPDEGHVMSVRDLATLAGLIVNRFPDLHQLFSIREFTWEGITQQNRNPLLYLDIGATGMKTGHTEAAGYGLTATAEREGRRIALVVAGLNSVNERRIETEKLMNWAYREFRTGALYTAGDRIAEADVWIGAHDTVGLTTVDDIVITAPVAQASEISARIRYQGPVEAPISRGQQIAELIVETPGVGPVTYPLVAAEDVAQGGLMKRMAAAAQGLLASAGVERP